jgi:hypothetical protein
MKLVGFGCSFTYGSELVDPNIDEDSHHAHTRYRNKNVWLGRLADNLGYQFDNLAEPANSNFAIAQQVSNYFLNTYDPQDKIIICLGWTAKTRMSWYSTNWVHNGFAGNEYGWYRSAREWVNNSTEESHNLYTDNAKFIVNNICKSMNTPIIQFNAIGHHKTTQYPNYFIDGNSMDSMIRRAMAEDERLDLIAKDGHPNEAGHEYFTIRLTEFVKSNIIT